MLISNAGVGSLCGAIEGAATGVGRAVKKNTDLFGDELAKIWQSKKAHDFTAKVEEAVKSAYKDYERYVRSLHSALDTNVRNYNHFNDGNVRIRGLSIAAPTISIAQKIVGHFADKTHGDEEGLKEGHSTKEAGALLAKVAQEVLTEMQTGASAIMSSGAFEEEEIQEVKKSFQRINENFKDVMNDLIKQVDTSFDTIDTDAQKLKQQNLANLK